MGFVAAQPPIMEPVLRARSAFKHGAAYPFPLGEMRTVWLVLAVAGAQPMHDVCNAREFSDAVRLLVRNASTSEAVEAVYERGGSE